MENTRRVRSPAVDILENDQNWLILADVPRASADQIKLVAEEGELNLEAGGETVAWHRSFRLPRGVDTNSITGELKNGVLHVTIPKGAQASRRIPVTAA